MINHNCLYQDVLTFLLKYFLVPQCIMKSFQGSKCSSTSSVSKINQSCILQCQVYVSVICLKDYTSVVFIFEPQITSFTILLTTSIHHQHVVLFKIFECAFPTLKAATISQKCENQLANSCRPYEEIHYSEYHVPQ